MHVVARLCTAGVLCLWVHCFWVPGLSAAQALNTLTEPEVLERFMNRDLRVRWSQTRVDEVRAEQADRARWSNPGVFYSQENVAGVRDDFVVLRQELPVTGRLGLLREAGRTAVEATRTEVGFLIAQLRADVRRAFTALVLVQERETTLQLGLTELREVVRILRAREDAGEGSRFDRMRAERELVDWEAEVATAAVTRAQAQGLLSSYLGPDVAPASLVADGQLGPGPSVLPLATLLKTAVENRLDHRAAEQSVARFDAERRAAERRRLPTPTVSAGSKHSSIGGAPQAGYTFSVDLSVPLFDRGQSSADRARAQMARAAADAETLRVQIDAAVHTARAALVLREAQADRYRRATVDTAEELVEIGRVAYQEGELGILELLDAERQALEARLQALELTGLARVARIELDRVVGMEARP